MIRTSVPQHIFPQSQTAFVLPNKMITVGTAARSADQPNDSIRESTRANPVPDSERVQKGLGDDGHCVFVD